MEVSAYIPQFLKLYGDIMVFAGQDVVTRFHSHHAVEIIISFDSPCSLQIAEETAFDHGLLLRHDIAHAVKVEGFVIFIYVNPETLLGKRLDSVLGYKNILVIENSNIEKAKTFLRDLIAHRYSESEVATYLTTLLVKDLVQIPTNYTDSRISKVINHIKAHLHKPFNFHELKEVACLSESRLIHLFKKEVGIPIRKYLLWCRLHQAIRIYLQGQTLTQAAHLSGFCDVSHLTRTFVSMFGIKPSQILKASINHVSYKPEYCKTMTFSLTT